MSPNIKWFEDRFADKGLSKTRVGAILGLGQSDFSRRLHGLYEFSPQELVDLARLLGTTIRETMLAAGVKVAKDARW